MEQWMANRRGFLGWAAGSGALLSLVRRGALGGPGHQAPSDMPARGVVGTGGRGEAFLTPRDRRVGAAARARAFP